MRNRCPVFLLIAALVAVAASALAEQPGWVFAGPFDVGTVYDIKAADGVAYAGTTAGIYRSTPSGQGWELVGLRDEPVRAIAARSGSPVYAIVGDGGLVVSRDRGDSWVRLAASNAGLSVAAVDPQEAGSAYLGSYSGVVWKTTDSGATWKRVSGDTGLSYVFAIDFDPHENALLLMGYSVFNSATVLRRSTDGGATFTTVSITGYPNAQLAAIAGGTGTSAALYASFPGFLCRTTDGATTWSCSAIEGYVFRILEIAAASANAPPVVLAVSDHGLLVSRDDLHTWAHAGGALTSTFVLSAAFDAASGAVFAGSDTTVYRSDNLAVSWTPGGVGLQSSSITSLAVDPADPTKLLASASGVTEHRDGPSLFRSSDGGQDWSPFESTAPSGLYSLLVDGSRSSRIYGLVNGFFCRSQDGGGSWTRQPMTGFSRGLESDPKSPATIWMLNTQGLSHSDDGGDTWHRNTALAQDVYALAFDSHDPATLYAGSYYDLSAPGYYGYGSGYPNGGSIFVSRDLGATWSRNEQQDLGSAPIALVADPFAAGVVYAATTGSRVLRSSDYGRTWLAPANGLPLSVSDLVADPVRPGILYAAANGSVYRSQDGARTWKPFGQGLDGPSVTALEIAGDGRRLLAVAPGAGIYQFDLGTAGPSFPCVADAEHLCLIGGRYALEVSVQGRGQWSAAAAHVLTDRAGYFGFPAVTGDAGFPEVVVKMLPAGALGPGGAAIFHSSLTSLPYVLTLTDTVTGERHSYTGNEGGSRCGGVDQPFPDAPAALVRPEATAAPSDSTLALLDHRFSVTIHARHPRTGRESDGLAVAGDDRWGYFSMPDVTGDPALPEIVVKMVDFTRVSGKFWVFHTGLTGFDYTLTVRDTKTGAVRTYESTDAFCGEADTSAFPD